jgi:hypothetical protein
MKDTYFHSYSYWFPYVEWNWRWSICCTNDLSFPMLNVIMRQDVVIHAPLPFSPLPATIRIPRLWSVGPSSVWQPRWPVSWQIAAGPGSGPPKVSCRQTGWPWNRYVLHICMDYTKTLHVYVHITVIISTFLLLLLFNLPFFLPLYHVLPWERDTVLLAYLCVFSSRETVPSIFVDVRLLSLAMACCRNN